MTDPSVLPQVDALINQWRNKAVVVDGSMTFVNHAYYECADQLVALRSLLVEPPRHTLTLSEAAQRFRVVSVSESDGTRREIAGAVAGTHGWGVQLQPLEEPPPFINNEHAEYVNSAALRAGVERLLNSFVLNPERGFYWRYGSSAFEESARHLAGLIASTPCRTCGGDGKLAVRAGVETISADCPDCKAVDPPQPRTTDHEHEQKKPAPAQEQE